MSERLRSAVEIAMERTAPTADRPAEEITTSGTPLRSASEIAMAGQSPWMASTPENVTPDIIETKEEDSSSTTNQLVSELRSAYNSAAHTPNESSGTPLRTAAEIAMAGQSPWIRNTTTETTTPAQTPVEETHTTGTPLRTAAEIAMAGQSPWMRNTTTETTTPTQTPVEEAHTTGTPLRTATEIAMAGQSPWMRNTTTETTTPAQTPVEEAHTTGTPLRTAAEIAMAGQRPWMRNTTTETTTPAQTPVEEAHTTGTPLRTAVEIAMAGEIPWAKNTETPAQSADDMIAKLREEIKLDETPEAPAEVVDQNQELRNLVAAQNVVIEGLRTQMEALNATLQELIAQRTAPAPAEVVVPVNAATPEGEEEATPEDNRTPQEIRTELRERRNELLGNLANENDPTRRQEILTELRGVMDQIDEQTEAIENDQNVVIGELRGDLSEAEQTIQQQATTIAELQAQLAARDQVAAQNARETQERREEEKRSRNRKLISMIAGVAVGAGAVAVAPAVLPAAVVTGLGISVTGVLGSLISRNRLTSMEQRLASPDLPVSERQRLIERMNQGRWWNGLFQNAVAFGGGMSSGILITRAIQSVAGVFSASTPDHPGAAGPEAPKDGGPKVPGDGGPKLPGDGGPKVPGGGLEPGPEVRGSEFAGRSWNEYSPGNTLWGGTTATGVAPAYNDAYAKGLFAEIPNSQWVGGADQKAYEIAMQHLHQLDPMVVRNITAADPNLLHRATYDMMSNGFDFEKALQARGPIGQQLAGLLNK